MKTGTLRKGCSRILITFRKNPLHAGRPGELIFVLFLSGFFVRI
jgi:hypothetical protein